MNIIPEGFLLVDKPAGITSYDCIRRIKRTLFSRAIKTAHRIRVGHSGTLDTFATGLLIVAIGRQATKKLSEVITFDKVYRARASISLLTDTLDRTGRIIYQDHSAHADATKLESAIIAFGAGYAQTPPIFSALKHEGRRLSDLARRSIESIDVQKIAQTKERFIRLHYCEISQVELDRFDLFAHVSHGTYIRSLVNDVAQKAGYAGACTIELRRLSIGHFSVDKSVHLDDISSDNIGSLIIPV